MRIISAMALVAALTTHEAHAQPEKQVHRLTASVDYALRNRLEDRDGFWLATYELTGHAFPNNDALPVLDLACIGAAWGFAASLGGEETMCRFSDGGAAVLFARADAAEGTANEATLLFTLHGGRGRFAGLDGTLVITRGMDLTGHRPTGKGSMALRLVLTPRQNGGE